MDVATIKIKTLTPLWTGDENRRNTVLRETGLIGSLRWWYEKVVKAQGVKACDPNTTKCKEEKHCDVCELFGCTGWARKFRLELEFGEGFLSPLKPYVKIGTRKGENNLSRKVSGFISDKPIILKFIPLREINNKEWSMLNKTLNVISEYGALGAHISQGYGVIQIVENGLPQIDFVENVEEKNKTIVTNLIDDFFAYKINICFSEEISKLIKRNIFWARNGNKSDNRGWDRLWDYYHFIPIAYHIRDALRRIEDDKEKRHEIFGKSGQGSKVFVSHGYKVADKTVQVRLFGWVKGYRKNIKDKLGKELGGYLFSDTENSNKNKYLTDVKIKEEKDGMEILY